MTCFRRQVCCSVHSGAGITDRQALDPRGVARRTDTGVAAKSGNPPGDIAGTVVGGRWKSMPRPPASLLAFAAVSSLAVLGCTDDPPTPTEVRGQISSDLGNVLHETNAAF